MDTREFYLTNPPESTDANRPKLERGLYLHLPDSLAIQSCKIQFFLNFQHREAVWQLSGVA
jgi:hypothetical protein